MLQLIALLLGLWVDPQPSKYVGDQVGYVGEVGLVGKQPRPGKQWTPSL